MRPLVLALRALALCLSLCALALAGCGQTHGTGDAGVDAHVTIDAPAADATRDAPAPTDAPRTDAPADDVDGDGSRAEAFGGDDCDDRDPDRYPGNVEVCDAAGHDEDCDPESVGMLDADDDDFVSSACCNTREDATPLCGPDCDDDVAGTNPEAIDSCNGVDDDCSGTIDSGLTRPFWADLDGDGFGDPSERIDACLSVVGYVENDDDCDDSDRAVSPVAVEVEGDGIDNDCDGTIR